MNLRGYGPQRKKLLRDVEGTRSELKRANSLEEELEQTKDLSTITEELLQKVRAADDPMEVIQDPEIRAKAAAVVREASKRSTEEHLRHYDVQIVGGLSLADKPKKKKGSVVEMKTGEGKTLTATIPLYISSLLEKGSWLITVNDYLARRDAEWMGPVFTELGRTVGVLSPMNENGIQASYVYDPDEERAELVKKMHRALGYEKTTEDGKTEWVFDKESWDADNKNFTKKGLERLIEEDIVPEGFVPSKDNLGVAEDLLTHNFILTRVMRAAPEDEVMKYKQEVQDYLKENQSLVAEVSPALREMTAGIHYGFKKETMRATLTPEGVLHLAKKNLLDIHKEIAWGIAQGILFDDMPHLKLVTRKEAYDADITYGPSHEFVFDWLGDKHQETDPSKQVQRKELPGYALLDEVDYILIDDARTPHIINHEIEGVPSQYRFYMSLPSKVADFEKYEWSAARLNDELVRSMRVHSLLVDDLLPLRDVAEGTQSKSEGSKKALQRKLDILRENDVHEHDLAIITAFEQFEEGIHYEMSKPNRKKTEYRITEEGYELLHELGATPFPFNIHEFEENPDPYNIGSTYKLMQPTALIRHHLNQHVDFIYEPMEKKLRLTDRGTKKLKERGVLPSDEIVEQCEQVYLKLIEELLPLKHSKGRLSKRRFKSTLKEIEDTPLHDAFEEFTEDIHYHLKPLPDEGRKDFIITEEGFNLLYTYQVIPHPSADGDSVTIEHGVCNVLKAMNIFKRGEKYVVQPRIDPKTGRPKPQVILIDENSGRYMEGRRISNGLHEAIEAVNGIHIEGANAETAKISQQMFYDMLPWVAGMSGTAETSWKEFRDVYDMEVKVLPTNIQWRWLMGELERDVVNLRLEDGPLKINSLRELPGELIDQVMKRLFPLEDITYTDPKTGKTFHERVDWPHILVGPISEEQLEADEELHEDFLKYKGIVETVRKGGRDRELPDALKLNLAQFTHYKLLIRDTLEKVEQGRPILLHTVDPNVSKELGEVLKYEAEQSGLDVTVNTLYHENHDREAKIIEEAGKPGVVTIATNMAGRGVDIKLTKEAREAGGLYTPMGQSNYSARNDNQVKGRAARQGDPGSSQPIISVFDPYIGPFGGDRLAKVLERFRTEDALESAWVSDPMISKLLNTIQAQIEDRHAESREHTLDYDKVLDEQRKAFLKEREDLRDLDVEGTREQMLNWYNGFIDDVIVKSYSEDDDTIDYRKVSKLFGRTGAYSLTEEKLAARLGDDEEKERLRQDYAGQLDKALSRDFISQEERDTLGQSVEDALEQGLLPRDIIMRPSEKVRLGLVPEQIIGELKKFENEMKEIEEAEEDIREEERKLAIDGFFDKLENHIYSKALFDLVSQKKITWEDYSREFKGIRDLLQGQRGRLETLGETGKLILPAIIRKNVPENVPYDHSGFFEGVIRGTTEDELEEILKGYVKEAYDARGTPEEQFLRSRGAMLKSLDNSWRNHLMELESVRTGLRFPDKDPLVQYKREGTVLYHEMMGTEEELGSVKRDFVSGPIGYFRTTRPRKNR